MSQNQKSVEDFLSSPAAFSDGTKKVDRVKTHGAAIFLGDRDVLKIKRAVDHGYMDFTTLQKREAACKREIELNQPIAPSIYKEAVRITQDDDGRLALNGPGEVVEWAVLMRRYPEADVLVNVAR
ncbi:MAG: kinase, partial [Pseudomonadota bacterium]